MTECERDRIERLNMTSADDHRSRSHAYAAPQSVPVPQPVFTRAEVDCGSSSTDWDVPLRHSVPQAAAYSMGEQFTNAGPSGLMMSQTVADDPFGPSPPRENAPNIPLQNVPNLPVHQMYP